jgi:hypothetical protein
MAAEAPPALNPHELGRRLLEIKAKAQKQVLMQEMSHANGSEESIASSTPAASASENTATKDQLSHEQSTEEAGTQRDGQSPPFAETLEFGGDTPIHHLMSASASPLAPSTETHGFKTPTIMPGFRSPEPPDNIPKNIGKKALDMGNADPLSDNRISHAFKAYAEEHNMQVEDVTETHLTESRSPSLDVHLFFEKGSLVSFIYIRIILVKEGATGVGFLLLSLYGLVQVPQKSWLPVPAQLQYQPNSSLELDSWKSWLPSPAQHLSLVSEPILHLPGPGSLGILVASSSLDT